MTQLDTPAEALSEALARWDASEHPVVSCYVDWRVTGRGLHEAATVVREELHELGRTLDSRGPARASFDADAARIEGYLADEADPTARGIAIFACDGRGLWRATTLGAPVETLLHAGEHPLLLPLIEAAQDAARTLIALVDTRTLRLIELDRCGTHEAAGPHRRHPGATRHAAAGGWSQANFQRARDTAVQRFAADAAAAIVAAVERGAIAHLMLAGDEVIAGPLLHALPMHVLERVEAIEHLDIQAPLDQVADRIWPQVRASAEAERRATVRELAGRARGRARATADPPEFQALLSAGRIDTLALDPAAVEADAVELLLREALAHRSRCSSPATMTPSQRSAASPRACARCDSER